MRDNLDTSSYERPKRERKSRINWWIVTKICLYIIILGVSVWGWNKIVNTGYGLAKKLCRYSHRTSAARKCTKTSSN